MDFRLTEAQELLVHTARDFFQQHCPTTLAQQLALDQQQAEVHTVPRHGRQARRLEQGRREREAKRPRIFPGTIHEKIDPQDGDAADDDPGDRHDRGD